MFLVGTRLTTTGDVDSARQALDDFPEVIKGMPGGASGPRGGTGAGDISAVIGWPAYLDVIERRFTMLFKLLRRGWSTTIARIFNSLPGVSPFACWREPEAAKSMGEEALPLLETRSESGRMPFRDDGAILGYLALGRNVDALRVF